MAIKYRLYQDNRAESKNRGKWYARAIYPKTPKSTKDLAQMIQDNVSVKRADVIAVLDELVNVMKLWLQESASVRSRSASPPSLPTPRRTSLQRSMWWVRV